MDQNQRAAVFHQNRSARGARRAGDRMRGNARGVGDRMRGAVSRMRRTAAVLALLCAVLLLSSCARNEESAQETVPYTAGQMILAAASARQETEELYTDRVWSVPTGKGQTFEQAFMEDLKSFFLEMAAMNRLAEQRGMKLDAAERSSLESAASGFYASSVSGNGMAAELTEEETRDLFFSYALALKLRDSMASDRKAEVSESEARVVRVQELVFSSQESAEKASEEISSGTDFDTAGRDAGAEDNRQQLLKRGELPEETEKAVYALETGEVSGVLKENGTFCIYRCISSYEETETAANRQVLERERVREILREALGSYLREHEMVIDSGVWEEVVKGAASPYAGENFFAAVKGALSQ